MQYENREEIKSRMIRNAAKIWGYSEINPENDFDPLVSLLLNVMAAEFERLSGEVHASRARILERMIQIMTPDIITGPLPAHGILRATSNNDYDTIYENEQLAIRIDNTKANSKPGDTKELSFTPTGRFNIHKGKVAYMAIGECFFGYTNKVNKELIEINTSHVAMPDSTIWLGITEPEGALANDIQFFFSADLLAEKKLFYTQLPNAVWNDSSTDSLKIFNGYSFESEGDAQLDLQAILQRQLSINKTVLKNVNDYYRHQFVTLRKKGEDRENFIDNIPKEIIDTFSAKNIDGLRGKPIYWVKITFPEQISNQMLQSINCYINAFPVLNKRLYNITHEMSELVNVVPLIPNELFFDLEDVTTQEGTQLEIRNLENTDKDVPIHVTMRRGGIGRFDERDAQAFIENIIQLLRDESAAFSAIGKLFVSEEVQNMQQIINKLEQRISQKSTADHNTIPHLLVSGNDNRKGNSIFVRYWSTNGSEGNGVRSGLHVAPLKSGIINHHETYFITTTVGGRGHLSPNDKITAYKSALISRNRIISAEDIKLFCQTHLGSKLKNITIEKGILIPEDLSKGYTKTIDVKLSLTKMSYISMAENNEVEYWKRFLHQQLTDRSQSLTPYRIFIEGAA